MPSPSITLLHLSDLQFGPHHRFEGPSAPGGLLHRLRGDLAHMRDEEGLAPDLVLLTGDLTEYGLKSQFTDLLSFVNGLMEVTELGPRRIVVVPGNHDVNWKLSEAYFAERAGDEGKPVLPYWPKLKHYAEFFAQFYEGQTGLAFTQAEPWTFYEVPELKLVIAGLDSVIAESHRPEDHHGFLGEPQLDFFAGKLRPYKERGWLRIGAVHHDLLHPENEAARQDAKDLRARLLPYLNLVVHGHLHEEQLGWLHATVPVIGIGSAGVKAPERPPEVPNQYQILRLHASRVEYGTRAYVPDQKRWIGCLRSDRAGRAWKLEEKVAFERVEGTFSERGEAEAAPIADLARMVDAFRRHWASAYRREALFDLATMGEDADIPAGLDLLHVFLPQTSRREPPRLDLPRDLGADIEDEVLRDRLRPRREQEVGLQLALTGPPQPVDAVVTAAGEPWVLILGAPGAGKSALTRWLVLKLCAPGESLGDLPADLVPVRVELRRFNLQHRQARENGRSDYGFFEYLDEIHRERHLSLQGEPLRRLAHEGRLLWLFDGLDEVADPHARRDYAGMIVGLRERLGGRGVVTSRIVGARPAQPLFQQAGFSTYTLQDFDDAQIDAFIERWHRLAFPGAPEAGARRLERLRQTLRENRPVRELCGNPLLLTLIALLNRGAELPRQRHRLYERSVDLMAEQWEANKQIPRAAGASFDLPAKRRFLRQLAFEMMTELPGGSGNAVRQQDLVGFASSFCEREYGLLPDNAAETARQLIQHLRERNHILALLGGQTFGFVHKTFLEYLTAAEIHVRFRSHEWGIGELKKVFQEHWRDQAWEETLTLICGMIEEERPEQVVELLQGVLETVDPYGDYGLQVSVAFATRCVAEIRTLSQDHVSNLTRYLTDCVIHLSFEWYAARPKMLSAFRLYGPGWPDANRIFRAALDLGSPPNKNNGEFLVLASLALCDPKDRIPRLRQLVSSQRSTAELSAAAIREAALLGPWSGSEASSLLQMVEQYPERERLSALIALHDTGVAPAAGIIAATERARHKRSERVMAAAALLRSDQWRSAGVAEALTALRSPPKRYWDPDELIRSLVVASTSDPLSRRMVRSLLQSSWPRVRRVVAREMFLVRHERGAIAAWMDGIRADDWFVVGDLDTLHKLSQSDPDIDAAFAQLLDEAEEVDGRIARFALATHLTNHGKAERGAAMLTEMAFAEPRTYINFHAAVALLQLPSTGALGVQALLRFALTLDDNMGYEAAWLLAEHARSVPSADDALMRLAEQGAAESVRLSAARQLMVIESAHKGPGLRLLQELASSASDDVRFGAASALREAGQPAHEWRPTLQYLSRSAKKGPTRLQAAIALRDERRIAQLAKRSKSPKVRENATLTLTRLRLYRALLQVGRPRRGIVSFDGTRAGVIEETSHGSRFLYDPAYLSSPGAAPVSPTLPLRAEPYESRGLHPFFENLLPEGWLLDRVCEKLGLDRTDAFGLMLATCADTAGAVEIVPEPPPGPPGPPEP